jgi:alkyl sulfatase BDS1-like metallo-beta-lactamase superfamily hydrolase
VGRKQGAVKEAGAILYHASALALTVKELAAKNGSRTFIQRGTMDAKTLFDEKLPNALTQSPDKAKALNAVYQFNVTGDGQWTVDLKSATPSVTPGQVANADCTIEISSEDFQSLLGNPGLGIQLYFQGKLKVTGDPMLATKLQTLFSLV